MNRAKEIMARAAMCSPLRALYSRLVRDRLVVFMAHRFAEPGSSTGGFSPRALRSILTTLRENGIPVLSLRDAVDRILDGKPEMGVVFTVDDGYRDFATVAVPVFREFDAPVTVFLATGFVDRHYWFWWDRISFAIFRTGLEHLRVKRPAGPQLPLTSTEARSAATERLACWIKGVPEQEQKERVQLILEALAVDVPEEVPPEYEPLTWDQIRNLAGTGIDFAPHSVGHPTMGSLGERRLRQEIRGSFERLRSELGSVALPVFCYPYGTRADVSELATRIVGMEGMRAAVTAIPGYVGPQAAVRPYTLPRFSIPEGPLALRQIVSGFERFKEIIRGSPAS